MQSLEALRQVDVNNPLAKMLAEALIMSILVHVHAQEDEPAEVRKPKRAVAVKRYLDENYPAVRHQCI